MHWSSWTSGYSNNFRIGVDLTVSGTTISAQYRVEAQYVANDQMTLTREGAITGTYNFRYNQSGGQMNIVRNTRSGSRGSTYTFGARLSGVYNGASPRLTNARITVPAAVPSRISPAPTISNVTSSGFRAAVTAPASNGASITMYQFQRATNSGFTSGLSSPQTTSRNYTFTGQSANTNYWVRARARNSAGWGAWSTGRAVTTKVNSPNAPSQVVASRSTDTRQNLSWTRNQTTAAPYTNIIVARWVSSTGNWATIATLSGTATSYSDQSTIANRRYRYRVSARNAGGTSSATLSNYISTTPAAPTGVTATKSGSNISVSWSIPQHADGPGNGIEVWHAANGVWDSAALATLSSLATTYTHSNPNTSVTHQYRIKIRATRDSTNLYSSNSSPSNVVQLLSAPTAPTNLSPSGETFDANEEITFTWRHNPVDTTAQSEYQIRYRPVGGSWTTLTATTSSQSSQDFEPGTFENGSQIEWQVRTRGEHPDWSPYSSAALLKFSERPYATIQTPDDDDVVNLSTLTVVWDYYDAEELPQDRWRVRLYTPEEELLVEESGTDDRNEYTFEYAIQNETSYIVGVQVQDSDGLWSFEDQRSFNVLYARPPQATLGHIFDIESGSIELMIDHSTPTEDEVPVEFVRVWRSISGAEFELIADSVPPNASIIDPVPDLNSTNIYRVVSHSDLPSTSTSDDLYVEAEELNPEGHAFLNSGPGFMTFVRMRGNLSVSRATSRAKTLQRFAGRTRPVAYLSNQIEGSIALSGRIGDDTSTVEEFENFAQEAGVAIYRDPTGRRLHVSVDDVSISQRGIVEDFSISLTDIDSP